MYKKRCGYGEAILREAALHAVALYNARAQVEKGAHDS